MTRPTSRKPAASDSARGRLRVWRLMACDPTGRWTWSTGRHTLDQVRALIAPDERVYRVTYSLSPYGTESRWLVLVHGPPDLPTPRLTLAHVRRSMGVPPVVASPALRAQHRKEYAARKRRRAHADR